MNIMNSFLLELVFTSYFCSLMGVFRILDLRSPAPGTPGTIDVILGSLVGKSMEKGRGKAFGITGHK